MKTCKDGILKSLSGEELDQIVTNNIKDPGLQQIVFRSIHCITCKHLLFTVSKTFLIKRSYSPYCTQNQRPFVHDKSCDYFEIEDNLNLKTATKNALQQKE